MLGDTAPTEAREAAPAPVVTEAPSTVPLAPEGGAPRLVHEPALDGLRGLAVGAVLLFHLQRLDGGFLGVDLFFVLSGFLITSLLVTEHQARGAIDLGRFWARRARRLLPALLAMVVGVSVLLLTLTPEDQRARFRGEALATLGYVANWHRMTIDIGYWDIFQQPSPLDHTWSLAIEEQFYVVWPLIAVLMLAAGSVLQVRGTRPQHLGWLALAVAAVSFGLLAMRYSPVDTDKAYFGTDTRIGATLLGAALAAFTAGRATSPRRRSTAVASADPTAVDDLGLRVGNGGEAPLPPARVQRLRLGRSRRAWGREAVGWAGLAWLGWSVITVDGLGDWYYQGGLVAFGLAALVVVWAATGSGSAGLLARVLGWAPLRGLGLISYGVYLWHWPVDVYLTHDRLGVDRWALDATRLALTFVIAVVSYRWLEQPIRRGALRGWRIWAGGGGAAAVAVGAVVVATAGAPATADRDDLSAYGLGRIPTEGSENPYLHYPADIPPDATRVLVVGDSGAYHFGPILAAEGREQGFAVASSAPYNCNVANPEGVARFEDGQVLDTGRCQGRRRRVLRNLVDELDPDAVVYYLANAGGPGKIRVEGEWVFDCDRSYDEYLTEALREDVDLLTTRGAVVVFATSPYTSILDQNTDQRVDCRNDTFRQVARSRPDSTAVVDMNAFVERQVEAGDVDMFMDIVHLSPEGSRVVSHWLLPQLTTLTTTHRTP